MVGDIALGLLIVCFFLAILVGAVAMMESFNKMKRKDREDEKAAMLQEDAQARALLLDELETRLSAKK